MVIVPNPAKPFQNLRRVSPLEQFGAPPDLFTHVIQVVFADFSHFAFGGVNHPAFRFALEVFLVVF